MHGYVRRPDCHMGRQQPLVILAIKPILRSEGSIKLAPYRGIRRREDFLASDPGSNAVRYPRTYLQPHSIYWHHGESHVVTYEGGPRTYSDSPPSTNRSELRDDRDSLGMSGNGCHSYHEPRNHHRAPCSGEPLHHNHYCPYIYIHQDSHSHMSAGIEQMQVEMAAILKYKKLPQVAMTFSFGSALLNI